LSGDHPLHHLVPEKCRTRPIPTSAIIIIPGASILGKLLPQAGDIVFFFTASFTQFNDGSSPRISKPENPGKSHQA